PDKDGVAAGSAGENRLSDGVSAWAAGGAALFGEGNRARVPTHLGAETSDERDAEDSGDLRAGEQAQHRLGDCAEAARSRLAIGDHVSERAVRTGSERLDR